MIAQTLRKPMCVTVATVLTMTLSCIPLNPERDTLSAAIVIPVDGTERTFSGNLASLGSLSAGQGLRVSVSGESVRRVMLLREDDTRDGVGIVVDGALGNAPFESTIVQDGQHFLFVEYDSDTNLFAQRATATAALIDQPPARPVEQIVRVVFENDFLTDPGLFDPVDGTDEDRAFLDSITPIVRDDIMASLQSIFADTPIRVVGDDETVDGPASILTFSPQRVLADQNDVNDTALPPADPTRPECQVRVVFGEVLPSGAEIDPGNRVRDDEAVVYVGSFQGRGESCRSSAVTSLRSIVLTLSQTGAHEIGHLVGLQHVEQIDIMNRSATLAFQRELDFARGQVQIDRLENGQVRSEVFPAIVQEPELYFDSIFDAE